jgi:hypothetical protein
VHGLIRGRGFQWCVRVRLPALPEGSTAVTTSNGRRIQLVWLWFLCEGTQGPSPSTTRPIVMAPSYQVGRADSIAKPSTERPQVEEVIDQGGPMAKEAREMSAEFISRNEEDYGERLKDFITKHSI